MYATAHLKNLATFSIHAKQPIIKVTATALSKHLLSHEKRTVLLEVSSCFECEFCNTFVLAFRVAPTVHAHSPWASKRQ